MHSRYLLTAYLYSQAVFSAYEVVQADLSSIGITNEDAHVWDSLFQELDIETGELLFQWRASEHFMYKNSYAEQKAASKAFPLDFFHINSVEKDKPGNYLVSSREGHAILYIGGRNAEIPGQILWQLGGKRNYFRDIGGENATATSFVGQHDARWVNGEQTETQRFPVTPSGYRSCSCSHSCLSFATCLGMLRPAVE